MIQELQLNDNEELDTDFVLSKSNIVNLSNKNLIESKKIEKRERIDLTDKNSYLFKSWNSDNSPTLPLIQLEKGVNGSSKLWLHTNNLAERIELNSKKSLDIFFNGFESLPLLNDWQNYISATIRNDSCLLYTSPSPRDRTRSRMPSSA